jgi:HD-GYP domain-containing protein (c-di-GMP phosphodiesterase class II)
MRKIPVHELKPGMVFDKAVYIDMNNILVAPMVPLKEQDLNRLIKWGIQEVETAGRVVKQVDTEPSGKESIKERVHRLTRMMSEEQGEAAAQERELEGVYDDLMALVRDVFEKVRNGVGYDKSKILDAVDGAIDYIRRDKSQAIVESVMEHEGYYLYTLAASVAFLSLVTGISLGYPDHRLIPLGAGALLHDIGMVRVPRFITEKKGALTEDEYNRIKTHPLYGYRIITRELEMSNEIATVALQHHEAFDGSGYPRKSRGTDIAEFSRIVSICDAFVAMTHERSYRDEHLSYEAMKNILSESRRKYDPNIVKVFLDNMAIYPVGSIVQLSNEVVGKVVSANPNQPLRPKIQVLIDEFGERVSEERILDLQNTGSLFIKKPLPKSFTKQVLGEQ